MMGTDTKEELLARIAAARRDGRVNVPAESAIRYNGQSKEHKRAAFRQPLRKPRPTLLHVWRVACPNNTHLTTLVTSPIAPNYCPVCGGKSPSVTEVEPV